MSPWTVAFIAAGVIVVSSIVCAWAMVRLADRDERQNGGHR